MNKIILAGLVAVIAASATAVPAQAATPNERALVRQVKTLKAQAAKLKRERNTARVQTANMKATLTATRASLVRVTGERDAARASLGICQTGAAAGISTMTPMQAATSVLPAVVTVFESWNDRYGEDGPDGYYASGSKSEYLSDGQLDSMSFSFHIGGLAPFAL